MSNLKITQKVNHLYTCQLGQNLIKKIGCDADVGIWHETYIAQKGKYECMCHNISKFGLANVGDHIPATGKFKVANDRINVSDS